MDRKRKALQYFNDGFNCAQSVLLVFADHIGFTEAASLKIAAGFGAGMGRLQKTCGAVTGAFMVIGAVNAKISKDDKSAKDLTYKKIKDFADRFKKIHGYIDCFDLLGFDLNNEKEHEEASKNDFRNKYCAEYIKTAVELLEKYYI